MRLWNTGAFEGDLPFPLDVPIDFPVDPNLIAWNKRPPTNKNDNQEPPPGNGMSKIGVPKILTNLNNPVGTMNNSGTVDIVLECSEVKGAIRYELRVARGV